MKITELADSRGFMAILAWLSCGPVDRHSPLCPSGLLWRRRVFPVRVSCWRWWFWCNYRSAGTTEISVDW